MNDEWTAIRNCFSLEEAVVLKSLLETNGLEVFIADEHLLGVQPLYAIALGGVRVMVRSKDLHLAKMILDAFDTSEADSGNADDGEAG
jgi:hypothetical protein